MRSRPPKPARDPLAEDRVERFLSRHGLGRIVTAIAGLGVAGAIAFVLAISAIGVGVIALEAIDPTLPGRALAFAAPSDGPDHVARAGATTTPSAAPTDAPAPSVPAVTRAAAPSARAAAGHTPAAPPGRPWATLLAPAPVPSTVSVPARSVASAPAPTAASAPAPATSTSTTTTGETQAPETTTSTTTPAPEPSTSGDDEHGWDPGNGHGKGNGGCPPGQHKKGNC